MHGMYGMHRDPAAPRGPRRRRRAAATTATLAVAALATIGLMAPASAGLPGVAPEDDSGGAAVAAPLAVAGEYTDRFLEMYDKLHDPANGYFSPQGIPYHAAETLMVEAPDYGHETTSEAYSFWLWLEASYGQVTGDWDPFNQAWDTLEDNMIPTTENQPTNGAYNPADPATYAPEHDHPSQYPSQLDTGVSVGSDPIGSELRQTYGTSEVYGMHWLSDVDNVYGFGAAPGSSTLQGPDHPGPSYINTFQRGPQESVWETIPQPSIDDFSYGGPNGYLDLFTGDASYAKQWKYTNAPDADARAIEAVYWAKQFAEAQGAGDQIAGTVDKASKMGDYLRYALFDKYFKEPGCESTSCPAGSGRSSAHYLLSWYYAWGGALDTSGPWAWRIGSSHAHFGYQNPLAAHALSTDPDLVPASPTAQDDWSESLDRQIEFFQWLQSSEGGIAGGATNSVGGRYAAHPAGSSTFYGMVYDEDPVYEDPPSNQWIGMQGWGMERIAQLYHETGDLRAEAILEKWVPWVLSEISVTDTSWAVPSTLSWSGQPDTWDPADPGSNAGLHVEVTDHGQDVGVAGALARTLIYYAAASGDQEAGDTAGALLDAMWTQDSDDLGVATVETRTDYGRFDDEITPGGNGTYVPPGWSGTNPNGDQVEPGVSFLDIRSFYQDDPMFPEVQEYLDGGAAPQFTYHRFWAQVAVATAMADYDRLLGDGAGEPDTQAPTAPTGLQVTGTTASSVSLTWAAATDDVGVTGYEVLRDGTVVARSSTTSYTETGLDPETTYGYTVRAYDAARNVSPPSGRASATTDDGPVGEPGGCSGLLTVVNQWGGGFQAAVRITAGSAAIGGWTARFDLAPASFVQGWNGRFSTSGSSVTVSDVDWNGSLAAGASTEVGFTGNGTAPSSVPVSCAAD